LTGVPDETLRYLYGIVPASAPLPPAALRGIGDSHVRLIEVGPLAAVVSDVPAANYGESAIAQGLSDVRWAGARAAEHERVLTWFVDHSTVVPSTPFSLHASDDRVRARLGEQGELLEASLRRLAGHQELGIRIWRDEATLAGKLVDLSPTLHALEAERRDAPPGRRYLLGRRIEALRLEEAGRVTADAVAVAFDDLAGAAARARVLPIPPTDREGRSRTLVLDAVFLVDESSGDEFRRIVHRRRDEQSEKGFEWEFTGPWPAYHFVRDE
jgi:hypothetical protein